MRLRDCRDVAEAADLMTLEARLIAAANDLGFGMISGVFVVDPSVGGTSIQYVGNTAEAFQSQSRSSSLRKRDPVMRQLKRFSAPLTYDQSTYVRQDAGDLWEIQAQYGYKTGIAMSLHLPDRQLFVIGVDREEPLALR